MRRCHAVDITEAFLWQHHHNSMECCSRKAQASSLAASLKCQGRQGAHPPLHKVANEVACNRHSHSIGSNKGAVLRSRCQPTFRLQKPQTRHPVPPCQRRSHVIGTARAPPLYYEI